MKIKTTEELLKRISERYNRLVNKKMEYLWEDFLGAVEKAVQKLPDDKLIGAEGVTIFYYIEGDSVYRDKKAEAFYIDSSEFEYEDEPVCLGNKVELRQALQVFKEKAAENEHIDTSVFDLESLFEEKKKEKEDCLLDFHFFM